MLRGKGMTEVHPKLDEDLADAEAWEVLQERWNLLRYGVCITYRITVVFENMWRSQVAGASQLTGA